MNTASFEMGDMVRVDRVLYKHVGIYVGDGKVVHNDKQGGVVLSTLGEFASDLPVALHKRADYGVSGRQLIVRRAMSLVGRKFDLLRFNCEHVANWAQTGTMESPQLQAALVVLALLGLLAIFKK